MARRWLPRWAAFASPTSGIAEEKYLTATDPQPAQSKAKRRWFRYSQRRLLILSLLFAVFGVLLAVWLSGSHCRGPPTTTRIVTTKSAGRLRPTQNIF